MTPNWPAEILAQSEFYWDLSLWPRLEGLTDNEFFWEPAPDAWSVRQGPDGRYAPDDRTPEPDPPPVTTIAWRLGHLVVDVFETRVNWHFGDRTLTRDTLAWPGGADEAKQRLRMAFRAWNQHMHQLGEDGFAEPVGGAESIQWEDLPMVALVLHLQRELIHHGAEIALLRDLYRTRA